MVNALRVERVSFVYAARGALAIDDVSADFERGRITAVLGPNAAGKSTLLRLMLGLLRPRTGRILCDCDEMGSLTARQRAARLAYVPQRTRLDAPYRVREIVELGRFARTRSPAAVSAAIEECGLEDLAERRFHELSVGQQQRVALARAIAQVHDRPDAAAVLLDEPTSALDPKHVQQTGEILRRLADRGAAVVAVLHDPIQTARWADEVRILRAGRLLVAGPVAATLQPDRLREAYDVPFAIASIDGFAFPVADASAI